VSDGAPADSPATTFVVASAHLPTVGDTVRSILAQERADLVARVLVFGADVHGVVPADPRVRLVDDGPPAPACRAYNRGLALAASPLVALVDGDCVLWPDWLGRVARRHGEGWDAVSGAVEVPPGPYWATAYNFAGFHDYLAHRPAGPRNYLPTLNLSVRRAVAAAVGPVREDIPRVYDFDWTLRMRAAGFRLYFDPAARVAHHPCGITPRILWRTWHAGGACSQAVRRAYPRLIRAPWILDHPRWLGLLAPVLACAATARVAAGDPASPRLWSALPAIWLTKLAWCLGAAQGRQHGPTRLADYPVRVTRGR